MSGELGRVFDRSSGSPLFKLNLNTLCDSCLLRIWVLSYLNVVLSASNDFRVVARNVLETKSKNLLARTLFSGATSRTAEICCVMVWPVTAQNWYSP